MRFSGPDLRELFEYGRHLDKVSCDDFMHAVPQSVCVTTQDKKIHGMLHSVVFQANRAIGAATAACRIATVAADVTEHSE